MELYTTLAVHATPHALLRDPSVSPQAKALWFLQRELGNTYQSEFASYMGVTDRTIRNWQRELQRKGWMDVWREATPEGSQNAYRMISE